MTDSPRQLLERWVKAVNNQDRAALAAMIHPEYIDKIPQSGERTRGIANLFATARSVAGWHGECHHAARR